MLLWIFFYCSDYLHCSSSSSPKQQQPFCVGMGLHILFYAHAKNINLSINTGMLNVCSALSSRRRKNNHNNNRRKDDSGKLVHSYEYKLKIWFFNMVWTRGCFCHHVRMSVVFQCNGMHRIRVLMFCFWSSEICDMYRVNECIHL